MTEQVVALRMREQARGIPRWVPAARRPSRPTKEPARPRAAAEVARRPMSGQREQWARRAPPVREHPTLARAQEERWPEGRPEREVAAPVKGLGFPPPALPRTATAHPLATPEKSTSRVTGPSSATAERQRLERWAPPGWRAVAEPMS
ncbi:MAG TPA: hypothetical protein VGA41_04210 [Candidatus Dormibacteraeota bacterium]